MSTADYLSNQIIWNISSVLHYGVALEYRARVDTLHKVGTLHIYADHNPPHFHITITDKHDLKFRIDTLEQISGSAITSKQLKDLKKWYFEKDAMERTGQGKLNKLWEEMNPK